jgi:hypothetical protein
MQALATELASPTPIHLLINMAPLFHSIVFRLPSMTPEAEPEPFVPDQLALTL